MLLAPRRLPGIEARAIAEQPSGFCHVTKTCSLLAREIPGSMWLVVSALLGLLAVGYRRQTDNPALVLAVLT